MSLVLLAALALGAQAATSAPIVTGEVLDPGNLPVAGAIVRVECGGLAASTDTDAAGRFRIRAPIQAADCVLDVRQDGFRPWSQPVRDARPITARLTLGTHHESLTVRAREAAVRPASGTSDGELLRQLTNSPAQMIQIARAMAGAVDTGQRVYVDGSPRAVLPTSERVGQVTVNPDPYSAAFGDLDGARIEVETAPLAPTWRYNLNASPGSVSAKHPLGAGHQWQTRNLVFGVSGPVPGTALAWSAGVRRARRDQESPLLSPSSPGAPIETVSNREELNGVYAVGSYQRGATRAIADVNVDDSRAFAAGAGALMRPEAATDIDSRLVEMNASIRRETRGLTLASNASLRFSTRSSSARSAQQGVVAAGSLVGGGAALAQDAARGSFFWWSGRVSGLARGRPWRAGATMNRSTADYAWTPNPLGVVNIAPDTARVLFTQLEVGAGAIRHAESNFGTYGELQLAGRGPVSITSGLRVDVGSGMNVSASPRVSGTVRLSDTTFTFGAGQFVESFDAALLIPLYARANGGTTSVAIDDAGTSAGVTRVSIAPRRQWLASIGANRQWRTVELATEYRLSRIVNAPSLTREVSPSGWTEVFGSDARAHQEEARILMRIGGGERTLVPYYTWRRAIDTADGWWGAPISATDSAWAPTAGLASHEGGFVLSFRAPGGIAASFLSTLSSGRSMDLVFAPAGLRDALATPLRAASRNSAVGPATASVQLFASRSVRIERFRLRGRVGALVTNLLGRKNLFAPVNVVDSPLYGRATDAGSARSLSVWLALGQ